MKVGVSVLVLVVLSCSACKSGADQSAPEQAANAKLQPEAEVAQAKLPELPEAKLIGNRDERLVPADELAVSLPEPPETGRFAPPDVPLRYDDGAYSIKGLRADFDAQIKAGEAGSDVTVRAYVQQIHAPPPGCTGGPNCAQPHVFATDERDTEGRRFALLIGPYAFELDQAEAKLWVDEPEVVLELGQQYLFKGKFVRFSDTGFHDERGVLQFTAYQNPAGEWVYPRGAEWHPKQAARIAEQNARLLERVSRDAKDLERGR